MKPPFHVAASAAIGFLVYLYFKSASCAIISFLAGVLMDVDHIFDFHLNHGIKKHRLFFRTMYAHDLKKLILVFHSYELLILLWLGIILFSLNKYWISFTIGFTQHMLFDRLTNPINFGGYFLLYRVYHKFDTEKIVKKS
ncbi:MAG: hypothetical protein KAU58_01965 [Candidatus Omnitrophica bacterium]|nr:hypothetical protein [Candidatus Omnitrophota bacterium]